MRLALSEAAKCIPTPTAFCVGCVITTRPPQSTSSVIISTGHSRELLGNTHAEANALSKAHTLSFDQLRALFPTLDSSELDIDTILSQSDVYTTLEPCSIRTSGLAPCAAALIGAKVRRCFIGAAEPLDFVECEGARKLKEAGVEVVWLGGLEEECLAAARRGHT